MSTRNQNPEQIARDQIDEKLAEAGWVVQAKNAIDFKAGRGIAVREYQTDIGPADYVLFVDQAAVGVVEAKPADWGQKITTVEDQSGGYAAAKLKWVNNKAPLPFVYESTGFYAHGVKANVIFFDNHPASKNPWTKEVWYYDYRTNIHHTLKKKPMRFEDLADFIACYNPANRHQRKQTWDADSNPEGRWRKFSYEELIARDKASLDVFWLRDKSLTDLDNLPEPDELAEEIIENLEAGLASFRQVLAGLEKAS